MLSKTNANEHVVHVIRTGKSGRQVCEEFLRLDKDGDVDMDFPNNSVPTSVPVSSSPNSSIPVSFPVSPNVGKKRKADGDGMLSEGSKRKCGRKGTKRTGKGGLKFNMFI